VNRPRLPDSPFWVEPEAVGPQHVRLSVEESHHLVHVHRAKEGTPFQATDGQGGFFECVLESVERRSVVGRIVERREGWGELPRAVHLLVGLPDWSAVEAVIEHGVPLGAGTFDFVTCERSGHEGPGAARVERLERVARAGLKQSRRSRLPRIQSSRSVRAAVQALPPGQRFVADPEGDLFVSGLDESAQAIVQIAIGPPGSFTSEERELLGAAGFASISLGPSRLTTETASIALLSLVRNSLLRSKL
jgi:16S rRNA (uracil1498-N3)-methyltransferase